MVKDLVACYVQAVADVKRNASKATSKKAKKQKKYNTRALTKPVENFRYRPRLTVPEKCPHPNCGHNYLQKLYTDNELKAFDAAGDREYEERMVRFLTLPISMRNKQSKPRRRRKAQELKCACLELYGKKCPRCDGKNPEQCEICQCSCSIGPFERKNMEGILVHCRRRSMDTKSMQTRKLLWIEVMHL